MAMTDTSSSLPYSPTSTTQTSSTGTMCTNEHFEQQQTSWLKTVVPGFQATCDNLGKLHFSTVSANDATKMYKAHIKRLKQYKPTTNTTSAC